MRICFRERKYFATGITKDLFHQILYVAETNLPFTNSTTYCNKTDKYLSSHDETVQLSLRCLINALNQEHDNEYSIGKIFISKSNITKSNNTVDIDNDDGVGVEGIQRVLRILNNYLHYIIMVSSSTFNGFNNSSCTHNNTLNNQNQPEFLKSTQSSFDVLFWCIRLIYMLVSQR